MSRILRFVLAVIGLLVLAGAASVRVQRTTRRWFEHYLMQRAQLAVSGSRANLLEAWPSSARLDQILTELEIGDERILAAAACDRGPLRPAWGGAGTSRPARLSWRGCTDEIHSALERNRAPRCEFQPILGEVRELIQ